MAKKFGWVRFSYLSFVMMSVVSWCVAIDDRKVHVVYLGSVVNNNDHYSPLSNYHRSMLQQVLVEGTSINDALVTSYSRSFNGFAAKLTDDERDKLAGMKEVVSVFPSRNLHPQTTRSWDFMGFHLKVNRNRTMESDVIVGVIDTGIWPESESFNDDGFGPPPKKWKGSCRGGNNFTCNNKIIGARYYPKSTPGIDSARDDVGHGTHTASTAAGNQVMDASFFGLAQGTARGGVPSARIAAYKACHPHLGCNDTDILAAFDDAIADGVDIISISIGPNVASDFQKDSISIGAFHAMEKGILTVNSAGNGGPGMRTTPSLAPWILSVAASSTDRRIVDKVVFGNGTNTTTLVGDSINSFTLNGTEFPLINGFDATTNCSAGRVALCSPDLCLDSNLVKGKIVSCWSPSGILEAFTAGAVGVIAGRRFFNVSFVTPLPALVISDVWAMIHYINSTKNPVAEILKSEGIKDVNAPIVAEFSSVGPNIIIPEIMKPDISAPGVEILAAFSPIVSPSISPLDKRSVKFDIISGTSMSCPHVSGAAAYIKSFHPDWSPSAIKSALMTTASPMNYTADQQLVPQFVSGSGHLNPVQAVNPGLLYEVFKQDYIKLLCNVKGIDTPALRLISGDNSTCPTTNDQKLFPKDFNYPAISIQALPGKAFAINITRTVRNVGLANSTYKVNVFSNSSLLNITVVPHILSFNSLNQKKSFVVTVAGGEIGSETIMSSSLVWTDGTHTVTSPIVVYVISIVSPPSMI